MVCREHYPTQGATLRGEKTIHDFGGKVVFVSGATSGIGWSVAKAFQANGARVVGTGRDQDRLAMLAQEIDLAFTMDVTDSQSVDIALSAAQDVVGPIDILVNNAGIGLFREWDSTDVSDVQRVMDVNMMGVVRLTKAVLPGMIARGHGTIVQVASVAARRGYPQHTAYCASKHALLGWSRALRKEVAPKGVGVTVVCPPAVDTPFFARAGAPESMIKPAAMISADRVASALMDAVTRNQRCRIVGRRARLLDRIDRFAPSAMDQLQRWKHR